MPGEKFSHHLEAAAHSMYWSQCYGSAALDDGQCSGVHGAVFWLHHDSGQTPQKSISKLHSVAIEDIARLLQETSIIANAGFLAPRIPKRNIGGHIHITGAEVVLNNKEQIPKTFFAGKGGSVKNFTGGAATQPSCLCPPQ
jgi:hypothetical protein